MRHTLFWILFLFIQLFAIDNFSIANLSKLPTKEHYVFRASGSDIANSTVDISYHIKEINGAKKWFIEGSMPINKNYIEEEYLLHLSSLNIEKYTRNQRFSRGTRKTTVEQNVNNKVNTPRTFLIGPFNALMYVLRTYPFDTNIKELTVHSPSQESDKVAVKVKYKGKKSVTTPLYGKEQAHNLEVSLKVPLIGGFLPKVNYFFRDDAQKSLIAMEGAFSMQGKDLTIRLVEYSYEE